MSSFRTAEAFTAARAREIELVHEVVPGDRLAVAGEEVRQAVLQGALGAQADLMKETGRRLALRRASPEGQEGIAAFLDKRPPAWRQG